MCSVLNKLHLIIFECKLQRAARSPVGKLPSVMKTSSILICIQVIGGNLEMVRWEVPHKVCSPASLRIYRWKWVNGPSPYRIDDSKNAFGPDWLQNGYGKFTGYNISTYLVLKYGSMRLLNIPHPCIQFQYFVFNKITCIVFGHFNLWSWQTSNKTQHWFLFRKLT